MDHDRETGQLGQSADTPGLRPAHIGDPHYSHTTHLITEGPFRVEHRLDHPAAYRFCTIPKTRQELLQLEKGQHPLGTAVDVVRIVTIRKIVRLARLSEQTGRIVA